MDQPPPAKRMKLAVPAGVGVGGEGEAASPRGRRLRQTLLMVLFVVRVTVRTTMPASVSQISGMFQRYVDHTFRKYHEVISGKLEAFQGQVESKLEGFQGQFEGLRHEVRQLSRLCSNRHADQHTRVEPEHDAANGSNANIELRFLNCLKPPVYTYKDIKDENNAAIKVAVFQDDKKITTGPLSKVQIEILVLHGGFCNKSRDFWTEEEFEKHIVQGRDEQPLVLGTAWLTNGEVELSQIRFKEGSCRKKVTMAARVCKTEKTAGRVHEAIMKPAVEVKDRRNEPNEKRHPPRLDDEVYRLEKIAKDGHYYTRLLEAGISTVQGFLKALNKDSNKLRKILNMENNHNSWSKLIVHARKCVLEDKPELKRYQSEKGDVVLFFNCVQILLEQHSLVIMLRAKDFSLFSRYPLNPSLLYSDTMSWLQALVNKWTERAHEILEGIPFDHLMNGNVPERISSGTDVAAGPSVPAVGSLQPIFSAEHLAAYQGTGAAENWPCSGMNLVTQPIYTNANYVPMNTDPDDLNAHDQGQGTTQLGQQQIVPPSIGAEWQQNSHGPIHSSERFEWESMIDILQQPSVASTSAPPNVEPPQHLPQLHQMVPSAAAPAWTQPSRDELEPGLDWSAFPGSGHSKDW